MMSSFLGSSSLACALVFEDSIDPADYKKFIQEITNENLLKLLLHPERYFLSAAASSEAKLTSFIAISGPPGTGKTQVLKMERLV